MQEGTIESLWSSRPHVTSEQRTAFHEAGHSVACYKLFGGLDEVSIVPSSDCNGYTKSNEEDSHEHLMNAPVGEDRTHLAKRCTMLLCGPAAVEKLAGTIQQGNVTSDLVDLRELLQLVTETEEEIDRFTERIWAQARRFVRQEWEAIEAVANALMAKKTLSGQEVRDVIERVETANNNARKSCSQ